MPAALVSVRPGHLYLLPPRKKTCTESCLFVAFPAGFCYNDTKSHFHKHSTPLMKTDPKILLRKAGVRMPNILILGGGAAGLAAALAAAQSAPAAQVIVLERNPKPGKKLLATGNGRCNLTNLNMGLPYYHGQDAAFIRPAFEALSLDATLDFFHGLGLLTTAEDNGRIYPYSDQAGSVVDVLRFAADAAGVTTRAGFEVTGLKKTKQGFTVLSAEETLPADRVIVCCGGMAGGKLGGTRSGYELLQSLGHSVTKLYPALVQIKTDNTFVKALKGVRANADLRLCRNRDAVAASRGEVQFTDFGVSGRRV